MKTKEKLSITLLLSYSCSLSFFGCASIQQKTPLPEPIPSPISQIEPTDTTDQIEKLSQRIQELELKVYSLNDKLDASIKRNLAQATTLIQPHTSSPGIIRIQAPATEGAEDLSIPTPSKKDPEAGFIEDASIRSYRQAMIFFEAHKYAEAILELTDFIGKYPEHLLAGSAQYFCGESYYQQNEYKIALQEFENVLTTYPNSQHALDALHRVTDLQNQLKLKEKIEKAATRIHSPSLSPSTAREKEAPPSHLTPSPPITDIPITVPAPENPTDELQSSSIRSVEHGT